MANVFKFRTNITENAAYSFTIKTYGNVLSAITFLHGLSKEELHQEELDYVDQDYEVLVTVRAEKPHSAVSTINYEVSY